MLKKIFWAIFLFPWVMLHGIFKESGETPWLDYKQDFKEAFFKKVHNPPQNSA